MKTPLRYQISEYDCGPTTMLNAVSFLFEREEIPAEVIRNVMLYSLDCFGESGMSGESGTSRTAMMFLCNWLNGFGKVGRLNISGQYLSGGDVTMRRDGRIVHALKCGGAVVLRVMLDVWHYILVTGISDGEDACLCSLAPAYGQPDGQSEYCFQVFDPWYDRKEFLCPGMKLSEGHPMEYNRVIAECCFDREEGLYSIGREDEREAVVLYNTKTQLTEERTIEYFI